MTSNVNLLLCRQCYAYCDQTAEARITRFLPERDLRYVRIFTIANPSVVCLSFVTFVHPTQPVEMFENVFTHFCTLAVRWPNPAKLYGDRPGKTPPSGVKCKRCSQILRCWTCQRLYLGNGARYGFGSNCCTENVYRMGQWKLSLSLLVVY